MQVVESWECGDIYDNQGNIQNTYCGSVKVFRYSKGDKSTSCYYEGYVGEFPFRSVEKRDRIINKYKNKMW